MFQHIIRFSILNKLFIAIAVFFLIVGGIYCMLQIPVDAVPDITNNQVQVVTTSSSLAPQEVEKFITYPIEVAMANILDVTEIRSVSRYGLSVVTIVFNDKVSILNARQLVNEQIQKVQNEIPANYGMPQLMPITTGLGEIYQYTLEVDEQFKHKYSVTDLRTIQDWIVKRQLAGIQGIVEINSFGGYLKQYEVAIDPMRLIALNLTVTDVFNALEKNNQNSGGSYIEKYNNAYYIRAEGLVDSISDIEKIVITNRNGLPILIRDIAIVKFGFANRYGAMTKNGEGEAVGGITLMLKGANSNNVIALVKQRVAKVQKMLPEGITIQPYLDRSILVKKTITTVILNLFEGGLIVIFVLILLLGNVRAGIIVASVIPLALLFAFILMHLFGVSANLMSLGAIDFGIVVDGAVVIVEAVVYYIFVNFKSKTLSKSEMDNAVMYASTNIYKSAAFGVFIILIVFFPILTLTGIEGKTFAPMAKTVSFVILGAFILSITYVPMVSALFLKRTIESKPTFSDKLIEKLKNSYKPVLNLALKYKHIVVSLTIIVFIASILLFTKLGGEFMPILEEGDLAMQMTLPAGSSLTESIEIATRAEKVLMLNFPEVLHVISKIGTAEVPTDPMAIEDADIMIVMTDPKTWKTATNRVDMVNLMKQKLEVVKGASFEFSQPIQLRFNELMTGAKTDIAIKIYGDDMNELFSKANNVANVVKTIKGAADVKVEKITGLPQIVIKYNRERVAKYGLNINELNNIIRTAYAGEKAGIVFEGEKKFDLVVRLNENARKQVNLNCLYVRTCNGNQIPLSELAETIIYNGPMQISRDATKRRVIIGVNVRNTDIESLVANIEKAVNTNVKLKPGYYIAYGGQFENLAKAKKRLAIAIPVALALILLLLFFAFGSIKYAILIFTAVPLSAIGGIVALAIFQLPFSISAGVGFIALFGVSVLNGIVLISRFNQLKVENKLNLKQIVEQGTLSRFRPVMMTALVASLGFLPMALATGAGGEVQKPLAIVVIGGIITATMLTMILLPILYIIFNTPFKKYVLNKNIVLPILLMLPFIGFTQSKNSSIASYTPQQGKGLNIEKNNTINDNQQNIISTYKIINDENFKTDSVQVNKNIQYLSLQACIDSAIAKSPLLVNSQIRQVAANDQWKAILDLKPTEITYRKGQINSSINDYSFEVKQNFGSPPVWFAKNSYVNNLKQASVAEFELVKIQVIAKVKMAWFEYIYRQNRLKILDEQLKNYFDFKRIVNLHYQTGENSLLEKTMTDAKYYELKSLTDEAYNDLLIAEVNLARETFIKNEINIAPTELQMFELRPGTDTATRTPATILKNYYLTQANISISEYNIEKCKYFPEISAGIFNQSINNSTGFKGWQIGLSMPLWFLPQSANTTQARAKAFIARNNANSEQVNISRNIENLQLKLNKYFERLNYFYNGALKQAEVLENTANSQFNADAINYLEYLQITTQAMNIKLSFLETLNNYNMVAIELEIYSY